MTETASPTLMEMTLPELVELRAERKDKTAALNKAAKQAKEELDDVEGVIIAKIDAIGVEGTNVGGFAVNIVEEFVPTDIEWDTFLPWAAENDQLHLLQRRMSSTAWREYESIYGEYPPGTQCHKSRKLSVVKRKSNKK